MERRLFVKQAALLSSLALVSSPAFLYAKESKSNSADISSSFLSGKKIKISGLALDCSTNKEIEALIQIKTRKGIFSKSKEIVSDGGYSILGNLSDNRPQKIEVKIQAKGYKTFEGHIYFTAQGCRIHSDMWNYNPDFKPEFIPKNEISASEIVSQFNFYLVKA
jgi:hypothetical protein